MQQSQGAQAKAFWVQRSGHLGEIILRVPSEILKNKILTFFQPVTFLFIWYSSMCNLFSFIVYAEAFLSLFICLPNICIIILGI